jgi:hypothetical protein
MESSRESTKASPMAWMSYMKTFQSAASTRAQTASPCVSRSLSRTSLAHSQYEPTYHLKGRLIRSWTAPTSRRRS